MRNGYVYMLANKPYGTLYIGVTNDISRRVYDHRQGTASVFTRRYGLKTLVWYEIYATVPEAIQRETSLKRWKRDWKIDLINQTNPEWKDLYSTLI